MSERGSLANLPDEVLMYRMHLNSLSVTKANQLHVGYAYALVCAEQRANSQKEIAFADFEKTFWKQCSFIDKVKMRSKDLSELAYRKAVIRKCEGAFFKSLAFLLIAGLLRPQAAFIRIKEKFIGF